LRERERKREGGKESFCVNPVFQSYYSAVQSVCPYFRG